MTVQELRIRLQDLPGNWEVVVSLTTPGEESQWYDIRDVDDETNGNPVLLHVSQDPTMA